MQNSPSTATPSTSRGSAATYEPPHDDREGNDASDGAASSDSEQSWVGKAKEEAQHQASAAGERASATLSTTKQQAVQYLHEQRDALKNQFSDARDAVNERAYDAVHYVADRSAVVASQKQRLVADELSHIADAAQKAAHSLREQDDTRLAGYALTLARTTERGAAYLRNHEPAELLAQGREVARRYPELCFGALFIAGLAAARFLKSSEHRSDSSPSSTSAQ